MFEGGKVGHFLSWGSPFPLPLTRPLPNENDLEVSSLFHFLQYFVGCVFQALEVLGECFLQQSHLPPVTRPVSLRCVALLAAAGIPAPRFRSLTLLGMAAVAVFILTQFPEAFFFGPMLDARSLSSHLRSFFWSHTRVSCCIN